LRSIRNFKNLFLLMLMALVMIVAIGCGGTKIELSFEEETYTVEVGKELPLEPTVKNEKDEEFKLVFSSEDTAIATYVDGKVKGIAVGEVKVKVTLEGHEKVFAEVTVEVVAAKKFTVTFNTDGGSAISAVEVTEGGKVTKPANPTKAGHVFVNWYSNSAKTTVYNFDTPVTAALTLYAKWEVSEYDVTFDTDGGSEIEAVGVNHGDKVTQPDNPTKEGHNFVGWFSDEELTEEFDFDTEITADTTLYAKWELKTYNVTFNLNGGTGVANVTAKHGEKVTEPENDPTKDNYVFAGWYKEVELTNEFDFETEVITANTVIFAKWDIDTTKISDVEFVLDGGQFPITSLDAFINATPVKSNGNIILNETVAGYYVSETEGSYLTSLFLNDKNYTMSPSVWQNRAFINRNEQGFFEVQLVLGTGSAFVNPTLSDYEYVLFAHSGNAAGFSFIGSLQVGQIITIDGFDITTINQGPLTGATAKIYNADETLSTSKALIEKTADLPVPVKEFYEFKGWYTTADFSGTAVEKAAESGKYYAKFEEIVYTITYEKDGGEIHPDYFKETRTRMINDFLTDFYNFLDLEDVTLEVFMHGEGKTSGYEGLYYTADNFAKLYAANNKAVDPSTGLFINQPEYNKWVPLLDLMDEYTKLNPDQSFWGSPAAVGIYRIRRFINQDNIWGGWIDLEAFNRIIVEVIDLYQPDSYKPNGPEIILPTLVKANHDFLGWYDNDEFTGNPITKVLPSSTGDLTLYAKFELSAFNVEFNTNGGSAIETVSVEQGEKVTEPSEPVKDGFMFKGWYTDEALTLPFNFETEITANITLYAAWEAFVEAEVDYTAYINEERQTYYIKVTVPDTALELSDIKSVHTFMAAGEMVTPVELAIVAGDPYLWFGVAKLDGVLYKEEGLYAYKVVRQDDSEFVFSFVYQEESVTGLPERVGADIDYKAILNAVRETYYIKVSVADGELLDAATIKSIRTIKEAGVLITPKSLTPDTDTVLWFGVADLLGVPTLKSAGVYAYEVVKLDDTKYVFEFTYDPQLVTNLPEVESADIDYNAVWNADRNTWYIKVTTAEALDAATVKAIYNVMAAGLYLDPEVELTPDTDTVLWFGVAGADGQLTLKEPGTYMYRVVRQDDTEYVFGITLDLELVTGIEHTIKFDSQGGSVVEDLVIEKGLAAVKPEDPTKEAYTFAGWYKDTAFKNAFDWDAAVEANVTLYAKWELTDYTLTFNLNDGQFVYPKFATREAMIIAFLTDYYTFLDLEGVTLETFMHGEGKTTGYDGTYHTVDYISLLYASNNKAVDASTGKFINQPEYNKWVLLLDLMHEYAAKGNPAQSFWGSPTGIGTYRIKPFIQQKNLWPGEGEPKASIISEIVNRLPVEYNEFIKYTILSEDITLPTVTKAGYHFVGWYDNAEFDGTPFTKVAKGSLGNKEFFAKFVETVLIVTGDEEVSVDNTIDLVANINVTWSSSDETVATVDAEGKVTALKAGNVVITALSADKQKFEVEVKVYDLPTKISFRGPAEYVVGGTGKIYGLIEAGNNPAQDLQTYTSSDTDIFTVDANGLVTAVAAGEATLTITSELVPAVTRTQTITVFAADHEFDLSQIVVSNNHVENESLYHNKNYVMGKNGFTTLQAALAVAPANAKIYVLNGTYADAATVTQNGLTIYGVKAVIKGTINVQSGVTDLTIRDLDFTGAGQVVLAVTGGVNNFTFTNNYVYDVTATVVNFKNDGTAPNNNIIISNNVFEVVKLTAFGGRYVRGGNTINITISNNYFKGLKANYVDSIRLEGNNETATAGIGMAGVVNIENNELVNSGQRAIWIRRYSATEVNITGNILDYAGDQTYGGGVQLENWVSGQATVINVNFNTFKNIIATFAVRINNNTMLADATWEANINYNKFFKLGTAGTNFYIQAYSEAAKGLINADYNFFEVAPTATTLLAQVGSFGNTFATEAELDAYDPLGESFYETDLETQTAIAYSATSVTLNDLAWTIKETYLSIPGDTNGDRVNAEADNLRMLRLRGANTAYIETTNYVNGLKNFVFDAKYYNASHSTSVMTVSKQVEGGEWVVVETILLTDQYETQVVKINETGNVKVRIDVTVKSANIDNIKFYK